MMGLLDDFEQYPDYAMRTTQSGKRIREPWASGPSPLAQGLMALGSGMVGDGATPWVGGGGAVWDDIGRGMQLGTQAFLQGHQNLQDRRSDYYTHRRAEEDQLIKNQKYRQEQIEKQALINNFPSVLKSIADTGRPELQQTIPMIKTMFTADPNKAISAAMEIISQIEPGEIKIHPVPGTDDKYITQGKKFVGQFKGGSRSKTKTTLVGQQALKRIQQDSPEFNVQGTNVNNLAVKLNADGSIESYSFIEPNEKLTVTKQEQYSRLADKYNATPQYKTIAEGVSSLLTLKKLGTENPDGRMGFNDVAMLFAFMKSLDPTSVVRESEYATAANAGVGVPEKIWKAYNRALKGEILLPQLRIEIIRAARDSLLAKEPNLKRIRDSYIKRGVKVYKFDKSSLESLFDNPFDTIRNMKLPKSNKKTSEFIGSVLDDNSDDEMMEDSD